MSDRRKTQCEKVIDYMRERGSITQMEAMQYTGCSRLASRISDLRRDGYDIDSKLVKVKTRDGHTRVARYSLVG